MSWQGTEECPHCGNYTLECFVDRNDLSETCPVCGYFHGTVREIKVGEALGRYRACHRAQLGYSDGEEEPDAEIREFDQLCEAFDRRGASEQCFPEWEANA